MLLRRLALAFSVILGVLASQLPEYAQQYRQRLGGAIDELSRIVSQFESEAQAQGLAPAEAVQRLRDNADILARQRGQSMQEIIARHDRLAAQRRGFIEAGPLRRLAVLARDFDAGIARNAYADFEPAVPVTSEGFLAGLIGFILGGGLIWMTGSLWKRRPRRSPAASPRV